VRSWVVPSWRGLGEAREKPVAFRFILLERDFGGGFLRFGDAGGDQRGQLFLAQRPAIIFVLPIAFLMPHEARRSREVGASFVGRPITPDSWVVEGVAVLHRGRVNLVNFGPPEHQQRGGDVVGVAGAQGGERHVPVRFGL